MQKSASGWDNTPRWPHNGRLMSQQDEWRLKQVDLERAEAAHRLMPDLVPRTHLDAVRAIQSTR